MVCRHARIWRDDVLGKTIWIGRLRALGCYVWGFTGGQWGEGEGPLIASESYPVLEPKAENHLLYPRDWRKGEPRARGSAQKKLSPASLSSREVTVTRACGWSPRSLGDQAWPVFSWCGSFFSITLSPSTQQDTLSPSFLSPSGTGHLDHSLEGFA